MKPKTKLRIYANLLIFLLLLMGIFIGWTANELYGIYKYHRALNGLFIWNVNYSTAMKTTQQLDPYPSDWVCTNTKGMSYDECVSTAQHECAHEVWAEICEDKNSDLCKKGQELLNNNTLYERE
jgi:hypothetical protein